MVVALGQQFDDVRVVQQRFAANPDCRQDTLTDQSAQRILRNVVPLCEQTAMGLGNGCGVVETTRRNECNCGIRYVSSSPSASIFNVRIQLSLL